MERSRIHSVKNSLIKSRQNQKKKHSKMQVSKAINKNCTKKRATEKGLDLLHKILNICLLTKDFASFKFTLMERRERGEYYARNTSVADSTF
jgi:hypothetical protein